MLHLGSSLPELYQLVNVLYLHRYLSLLRAGSLLLLNFRLDGRRLLDVYSGVDIVVNKTVRVLQRGTTLRLRGTTLGRGYAANNTVISRRSHHTVMVNHDGSSASLLTLASYGLWFLKA